MNLLSKILSNFIRKNHKYNDMKSNHIFYKIIDSSNDDEYTLQCINTSALFFANVLDIVFDTDILQGLHPVQACFIGIEYAKHIKKHKPSSKTAETNSQKMRQYSLNRYGRYSLCYQNRKGELCFINRVTNKQFIMHPHDIAFSKELIAEFDATQAFHIGLLAGLKIENNARRNKNYSETRRSFLYLVK